jgi:hypothetical protein
LDTHRQKGQDNIGPTANGIMCSIEIAPLGAWRSVSIQISPKPKILDPLPAR